MKANLILTGLPGLSGKIGLPAEPGLSELRKLEPLLDSLLKAQPHVSKLGILPVGRPELSRQLVVNVAALLEQHPADVHIFCGTPLGKALGIRVAALIGLPCYGKGEGFVYDRESQTLRLRQKAYSTHQTGLFAVETAREEDRMQGVVVISAAAAVGPAFGEAGRPAVSEPDDPKIGEGAAGLLEIGGSIDTIDWIERPGWDEDLQEDEDTGLLEVSRMEREDDLAAAKLVFVGGKGLGSRENYLRLKKFAGQFGAACGCSRPAAMSGWDGYDRVVGVSGVCLTADVCVTFGVSGAGPMMYGLEQVGRLIAVNTDRDAPIFRYAKEGILEDCSQIMAALEMRDGPA